MPTWSWLGKRSRTSKTGVLPPPALLCSLPAQTHSKTPCETPVGQGKGEIPRFYPVRDRTEVCRDRQTDRDGCGRETQLTSSRCHLCLPWGSSMVPVLSDWLTTTHTHSNTYHTHTHTHITHIHKYTTHVHSSLHA